MRTVPAALRATLGVAVVVLVGGPGLVGLGAPASAEPRGHLTVSAQGVSFDPERVEDDGDVVYLIRSLGDPDDRGRQDSEWLRQELDRDEIRAGYVAFAGAWSEMPEGYCVAYVKVDGAGEWAENPGSTACTSDASATPSPSPEPTRSPSPTPTPTPSPTATPSPSVSPTPTPSASPSPSPSPKPSKASASPSPDAMAIQGEALARSFSGELPEPAEAAPRSEGQGRGWIAAGLVVAALSVTAAGAAVWWGQKRG